WQDVLHEGPVPALPRHELLRSRAGFLADCGWGSSQALRASLERRDRQLLEALRDGLQVVLWFEHDLYDQLQLLDALALAQQEEAAPELIVVGSFPGRPSFHGLGELTAGELETLWPARRPADPAARGAAAAAWSAFRAPDPTALAGWATRETPELPFLAPALRRLLDELPAPGDGLSGTERRALAAIAGGARTPPAAFVAAQRLEEAPFLGDTWFHRSLAALGQGSNRLVETDDGDPLPPPPPPAAPAGRQPALRPPPASPDVTRGARAARRGRPGRAARHRPLDRRHPRHAWRRLALGPHGGGARQAGPRTGRRLGRCPVCPRPEDQLGAPKEGDRAVALAGDARIPHLGRAAGMDAAGAALD